MRISDWSSDVCSSDLTMRCSSGAASTGSLSWNSIHRGRLPSESGPAERAFPHSTRGQGLERLDRKSTRLTPVTNAHLVCRRLLEEKKQHMKIICTTIRSQ